VEVITLYNHAACLVLHDLDKSKQVLSHAEQCIDGYQKLGDIYSENISRINKADSLWSLGYINASIDLLLNVLEEAKENDLPHVIDIASICLANSLSEKGEYNKAKNLYEVGLNSAKKINHDWDYIYALIYSKLNQIRHQRTVSKLDIESIIDHSEQSGYKYLLELSQSLRLVHAYSNNEICKSDILQSYEFSLPLGISLKYAIEILSNCYDASTTTKFLQVLGKTEGFKFYRELIIAALEKVLKEKLTSSEIEAEFIKRWLNVYSTKVETDIVKLKVCDYSKCEARCCYDGVYLIKDEEEMINQVVNQYPEYFTHLPKDYIVNGNWGSLIGRKTQVKPYNYLSPDYPSHFNQTRCVFAMENGACSLQHVSMKKTNNPWTYKPNACKLHPLQTKGIEFFAPPKHTEKDKHNIGVEYPGYVSYTPCGIHRADGQNWAETLQEEIEIFKNKTKTQADMPYR
jgi:hypothetical protein